MVDDLNPFYFSTSIIFIDDDSDFIKSFIMLLDERLPIHVFSSPSEALTLGIIYLSSLKHWVKMAPY
ncbi:MAG: hypothetical protein O7D86_15330 [Proteobacteria bacterium]|nr:hypothetical protein [Pseudomonadota bacterium]